MFSAAEPPLHDLIKMLTPHGNFDVDKILNELVEEYSEAEVLFLFSSDNKYYFKTSKTLREFLLSKPKNQKFI